MGQAPPALLGYLFINTSTLSWVDNKDILLVAGYKINRLDVLLIKHKGCMDPCTLTIDRPQNDHFHFQGLGVMFPQTIAKDL